MQDRRALHDRLRACIEELRVFSMRSRNADLLGVIERRIDESALGQMPEERTALERLAQVIEMLEARKRPGGDWTIAKEYVHSLLQRLARRNFAVASLALCLANFVKNL